LETIVSNDERVAIAEVDYIIHHMNERYLNMIPQKVQDYITILKKKNIEIYVDPRKPLEQQGLKEFTLNFLIVLNLKYWCDEQRRKDILTIMDNNQKKFDAKINNIFAQAESIEGDNKSEYVGGKNIPKHIIVTGTPNTHSATVIEQTSSPNQTSINELDKLKQETEVALKDASKINIFTKIIDKLKSIFNKNKQE
jgi:hypothetical protein